MWPKTRSRDVVRRSVRRVWDAPFQSGQGLQRTYTCAVTCPKKTRAVHRVFPKCRNHYIMAAQQPHIMSADNCPSKIQRSSSFILFFPCLIFYPQYRCIYVEHSARGKIIVREISIIYRVIIFLGWKWERRSEYIVRKSDTHTQTHTKNRQRVIEKNANSLRERNKNEGWNSGLYFSFFFFFFHKGCKSRIKKTVPFAVARSVEEEKQFMNTMTARWLVVSSSRCRPASDRKMLTIASLYTRKNVRRIRNHANIIGENRKIISRYKKSPVKRVHPSPGHT